jgi:uncharacterized membrane protein
MSESNPYQPPAAPPASTAAPAAEGRAVDAGRGWEWVAEGWSLFMRQPGTWIGITVAWMLFSLVCHFVPLMGIASIVISPVLLGGVMLGAQELHAGGNLRFDHLFAGFRKSTGALIGVGLAYLGCMAVIMLITSAVIGFALLGAMFRMDIASIMASAMTVLLGLLIALALLVPVMMMLWFASTLIVLQNTGTVTAMKASFVACLKNIAPFLVYGVVLLVPSFFATLLAGLGWLVLGPVILASIYTSYRDIFLAR